MSRIVPPATVTGGRPHFGRQPTCDISCTIPERLHEIEQTFGKAWVFYPDASQTRCEAALALDVPLIWFGTKVRPEAWNR
jgi:RNA repair, ligase-Pnkp-associating, region of Hen1